MMIIMMMKNELDNLDYDYGDCDAVKWHALCDQCPETQKLNAAENIKKQYIWDK